MACNRFLRSVWIFGFCLGKFNYGVLRNQVGNLDIVFIGNLVINHLISDEELNIRSFRLRTVTTATRPTHQVYSIFSAHVGRPYCHTPFSPISEWKTEKWLKRNFFEFESLFIDYCSWRILFQEFSTRRENQNSTEEIDTDLK